MDNTSEKPAPAAAPSHAEIIDQWFRDTFHGSGIGGELSDKSHGELRAAIDRLKAKLK